MAILFHRLIQHIKTLTDDSHQVSDVGYLVSGFQSPIWTPGVWIKTPGVWILDTWYPKSRHLVSSSVSSSVSKSGHRVSVSDTGDSGDTWCPKWDTWCLVAFKNPPPVGYFSDRFPLKYPTQSPPAFSLSRGGKFFIIVVSLLKQKVAMTLLR